MDSEYLANLMQTILTFRDSSVRHREANEVRFVTYVMANWQHSNSQLFQDLFVTAYFNQAPNRFFVEFGACNGVMLSNTYHLEKRLGWKGIVCEPARVWHDHLRANRACAVDTRCVWARSGETLEFNESQSPDLSTIHTFTERDHMSPTRGTGSLYPVTTVSLLDLLIEHNAPKRIEYMSIDTEGSELEILQAFDFSRYDIRVITVEHNFTENREKIHDLLRHNGYRRHFELFSRWDDWYVKV